MDNEGEGEVTVGAMAVNISAQPHNMGHVLM